MHMFFAFFMKASYSSFPCSKGAEFLKLGRLPFLQSAYKVNWLTISADPPTSKIDLFIFLFKSLKHLKFIILLTILSNIFVESVLVKATKISKPSVIEAMVLLSISTLAFETRCKSTFMEIFICLFLLSS